ncbi:MAG: substrate-binding domain-containing protein [Firmicutes bacterium]|nr:substrate-binding domain-containing protein [Bacillota bacterium]
MKTLDAFLENNRRLIDAEIAKNSLYLAIDNPMILDSLMPLVEQFSKTNPNCQLHFLFGNIEDIYDKLNKNRIDLGLIENNASAKQNSIICEEAGCTIEPLNPSGIQIAVVWKKASSNALVRSFSELLASNQAAINAEYEK